MDIEEIKNLYTLLPEEIEEVSLLYRLWDLYKSDKDWFYADKIRSVLMLWDKTLNSEVWCPLFEHNLNRQRRAWLRMIKYKISIYPWEYNEKEFEGLNRGSVMFFPDKPIKK